MGWRRGRRHPVPGPDPGRLSGKNRDRGADPGRGVRRQGSRGAPVLVEEVEERREALIAGWAVQLLLGRPNRKSKEQEEVEERCMGTGLNLQMSLPPLQTKTQTLRIPPGHSQEVDRHQVVLWSPRSHRCPQFGVVNPL